MDFSLRALTQQDREQWEALFKAYAEFYKIDLSDAAAENAWDWIFDENEPFWCAVAVEKDGENQGGTERLIGFTQYQEMARSLSGSKVIYLSDLYTVPNLRTKGVGRALIDHVVEFARDGNYQNVRWLTQDFNYRARSLYDQYQSKSDFILYSVNT